MTRHFSKRKTAAAVTLSFLFTAMQITGYQISGLYNTSVHQSSFFQNIAVLSKTQCIFLAITEFILWTVLLYLLYMFLENRKKPDIRHTETKGFLLWFLTAALLFACWIPCFLAAYPGFYNYDAFSQVPQALYEEVPYSAHHPLIHTLVMGKIIAFGYHHGVDLNDGIALYSIFQMAFCAAIFSYTLCYIKKITGCLCLFATAFCYYAFFPVIPMFALSTTKDTIFSALLLLTVIFLYEACRDLPAFFNSKKNIARFVATSVLMCLFRKNGIYTIICVIPFLLLIYRKYWKQLVLLFGAVIILSIASNEGFIWILNAENASAKEMFSVPMQQIARVYNTYGEDAFEENELDIIYEGISREHLLRYDPFLSDSIKNYFDFNVILDNKMDYAALWVKKGLQYPNTYLMAFLANTYQAWYPGTSIYKTPNAEQTSYFELGMWAGGYRDTKMPKLLEYYEKIATKHYYQNVPVLRLFFSIGAMLWAALFVLGFAVYQKNRHLTVTMLMVISYCVTVFLGPVSLVRYYLILYFGFPVNICFLFSIHKPEAAQGETAHPAIS